MDEVLAYLKEFRVLLAIDNLETLSGDHLRDFLIQIPPGSKVLLTSRLGLGEIEIRYQLDRLTPKDALSLMRRFSSALNLGFTKEASEKLLAKYCDQLLHNPLLIKWFVSSVSMGANPKALLNRRCDSFKEALGFCFLNLFEKLGGDERQVLHILASAKRSLSTVELHHIACSLGSDALEIAMQGLLRASMVRRSSKGDAGTVLYMLPDAAREYIFSAAPPSKKTLSEVAEAMKSLRQLVDQQHEQRERYKYSVWALAVRSRDECICAVHLREALDAMDNEDYAEARAAVEKAKSLRPDYSEAFRVSAMIETNAHNYYRATEEYERALEIEPSSTITKYTFALYLTREHEDFERALELINSALVDDPDEAALLTRRALLLNRLGKHAEAAGVYDELLKNINSRPAKWRRSTRDQAADAYRRWAEADIAMQDLSTADEHAARAMCILRDAFTTGDYDTKIAHRYAVAVGERFRAVALAGDEEQARVAVSEFLGVVEGLPLNTIPKPDTARLENVFAAKQDIIANLQKALATAKPGSARFTCAKDRAKEVGQPKQVSMQDANATRRGHIHSIFPPLSYGFVVDDQRATWFFHRKALRNSGDWIELAQGRSVTFSEGSNHKGRCAVDVVLL